MLAPLLTGGRVRVVDDELAADPEALWAIVQAERITVVEVVPSLLRILCDVVDATAGPTPLRTLVATGEALPPELARRWLARFPTVPVVNAYGPTECSDDVTHHWSRTAPPADAVTVPIGAPIANTQLHVVDAGLRPVAIGVPGELLVGGMGVGRGYLDDPLRTAAAFVPDPFSTAAGARLYRTGDICRWSDAGILEFLGRRDHQVKVRGHRIELGEIEVALRALPGVADAVVAVHRDQLVGYVVAVDPLAAPLDPSALQTPLATSLPSYLVPYAIILLPELPLSAHGKVDRARLPAPHLDHVRASAPPETPTELAIAAVWADLLGLDAVGADDDFFALGGHSLLATRIISRLRAHFAVDLPLRRLFESPTVRRLAAVVDDELLAALDDSALGDLLDRVLSDNQ